MKIYFFAGCSRIFQYFLQGSFDPISIKIGSTTYTLQRTDQTSWPTILSDGEVDETEFNSIMPKFHTKCVEYNDDLTKYEDYPSVGVKLNEFYKDYLPFFDHFGEKVLVIGNPAIDTILRGDADLVSSFIAADYFYGKFDKIYKFDDFFIPKAEISKKIIQEINDLLKTTEGKFNISLIESVNEMLEAIPKNNTSETFSAFERFGLKKYTKQSLKDVYGLDL